MSLTIDIEPRETYLYISVSGGYGMGKNGKEGAKEGAR
jgi:hypothetical protein